MTRTNVGLKVGAERKSQHTVVDIRGDEGSLVAHQGVPKPSCGQGRSRRLTRQLDFFYEGRSVDGVQVADNRFRLDVPRRGHVLTTVADKYGKPIREAVGLLSDALEQNDRGKIATSLSFLYGQPDYDVTRLDARLVAWTLVSIWVVAIAVRAMPIAARLADAEKWFFGEDRPEWLTDLWPAQALRRAEKILRVNPDAVAYHELLPYILDPHGPGSRLSVKRNPATRAAQTQKRAKGVFYTPSDVAEYMIRDCLSSVEREDPPTIFDPACGTGVFLRAALKELRLRYRTKEVFSLASECLFGADIDPWAIDASAFVLLADICDKKARGRCPMKLWHLLRLNLRCIDTLYVDPVGVDIDSDARENTGGRISIRSLFPKLRKNPAIIVGNPPYAKLGDHPDLKGLSRVFKTLAVKPHAGAEIYVVFIEQMMRLARQKKCAGALVLPLSIACNIGPQFITARKLMQETSGHWRFAFFDREPHALFGEDVKTRNAIIFWSRDMLEARPNFASGPLRKWRSDSRAKMFSNIQYTEFDGDIRAGIPKVDGTTQAEAWYILSSRWGRLEQAVQRIEQLNLARAFSADDQIVFVGPTAYNFLNVFLRPPPTAVGNGKMLSENPLHAIRCATPEDSLVVFSILTSHLAYWWWHIHGDGFHVSRRFITEFPFGSDVWKRGDVGKLHKSGATLWSAIKKSPIVSLNRGRTSLSYSPNGFNDMRRCADEVLAGATGLNDEFVDELQQFAVRAVAARPHAPEVEDTEKSGVGP